MILLIASECVLASLANKARKYRFGDKKDYAYAFGSFIQRKSISVLPACGRDLESMRNLGQTLVAHFLEAEDLLDDIRRALNFGPHLRLAAVGQFDRLVDPLAPAIPLVGEVPGPRRGSRPSAHGMLDRPTLVFPSHAASAVRQGYRPHWPPRPAPCGSASCGCRLQRGLSSRNTIVFLWTSGASPGCACRPCSSSNSVLR